MIKPLVVLSIAVMASAAAMASESLYYWDNQAGLKKADHCQLTTTKNSRLSFAKMGTSSPLTLKNSEGKAVLDVIAGSIVKKRDGAQVLGSDPYEIVAVNQNLSSFSKSVYADRLENGYLESSQTDSIESRTIQIKENTLNLKAGTLLRVHGQKEYLRLTCPEFSSSREYVVFHAYEKDDDKSSALIGVYFDETDLFKNVSTFDNAQVINKFSSAIADEENIVQGQIKELSGRALRVSTVKKDIPLESGIKPGSILDKVSTPGIAIISGLDTIICSAGAVNVRNSDLSGVLFSARNGDGIKIFQGWGENRKETFIGGKRYTFTKVEFMGREALDQRTGFVADSFISARSMCPHVASVASQPMVIPSTNITGLNDPSCCLFPTIKRVTIPMTDGMRQFGWNRPGNRLHAANDLYRIKNEPMVAVAPGVVLRSTHAFYEGTYVTEVLHPGGFIVRYGETTGEAVPGNSKGRQVQMGQKLGYIGKIGNLNPMLHVEIYSGRRSRSVDALPLSQPGNTSYLEGSLNGRNFGRRNDLLQPTRYLLKWENDKFN